MRVVLDHRKSVVWTSPRVRTIGFSLNRVLTHRTNTNQIDMLLRICYAVLYRRQESLSALCIKEADPDMTSLLIRCITKTAGLGGIREADGYWRASLRILTPAGYGIGADFAGNGSFLLHLGVVDGTLQWARLCGNLVHVYIFR